MRLTKLFFAAVTIVASVQSFGITKPKEVLPPGGDTNLKEMNRTGSIPPSGACDNRINTTMEVKQNINPIQQANAFDNKHTT